MIKLLTNLYLSKRFFLTGGILVMLFIFGFAFPVMFTLSKIIFLAWGILFIADIYSLFRSSSVLSCERSTPTMMSLGDENEIRIKISNLSLIPVQA